MSTFPRSIERVWIGPRLLATALALAFLLVLPGGAPAWSAEQTTFDSPEAAVAALMDDLKNADVQKLKDLFGESHWNDLIGPDKIQAREGFEQVYEKAQQAQKLATNTDGSRTWLLGADAWPFPVPLVQTGGRWHFDSAAGVQEVIDRRVGEDELNAIAVLREYVDAQTQYASVDRNNDGILEYAQRIASTPGQHDGLYWADTGGDVSPLGPFVSDASEYFEGRKTGDPFKGYFFKILTRQGASAPGGRYDYIINGHMIAGFAMLAYPAKYENSGIMSFIVNQQGVVYQRDLGDDTEAIARTIDEFDPQGWTIVTDQAAGQ